MKIITNKKKSLVGFSLIEVVVFVGLLNLVLLASVNYLITFTYQTRVLEHKTLATFYQEDLKEWLDSEREADWSALYNKAPSSSAEYCVNGNIGLSDQVSSLATGACNYNGVGSTSPQIFRRSVLLWSVGTTQVNARITVSWKEIDTRGNEVNFSQTFDTIYTQY